MIFPDAAALGEGVLVSFETFHFGKFGVWRYYLSLKFSLYRGYYRLLKIL
jgi:hypothetical protein